MIVCFPLFLVGSILLSCQNDIDEIKEVTFDENFPALKVERLHTAITDSGKLRVVMDADIMQRFEKADEDPYDEYPEGIHVRFIENGALVSEIQSKYAIYYPRKELWEAKGDVVAENIAEQEKLNTEHLFWDMRKEQIYSDKFVRITTREDTYYGTGFESDQNFNSWVIRKPKGDFLINEDENI